MESKQNRFIFGHRGRKLILWVLKVVGLIAMVLGFYVRNADQSPLTMRLVCAECYHAQVAYDSLTHGTSVIRGEEGFSQLARIYLAAPSTVNRD